MLNIISFPAQKKTDKEKNEKWQRDCVDAAEHLTMFNSRQIRQSFLNKRTNYNLYNNILDTRDIEKVCNQHNLEISKFPAKMQHIGIGNSKIRLLVGEESKRRFDWRAVISSSDEQGVSSKEDQIKQMYMDFLMEKIQNEQFDQESAQRELNKLQKYINYDFQDIKEITANKILKHEVKRLEVKTIFNDSFLDLLIAGEEIACIEEVCGDIVVRKCSPLNVFTLNSPYSNKIEDSEIIVEYGYGTVGSVIDQFYEYLTPQEIDKLEAGDGNSLFNYGGARQMLTRDLSIDERFGELNGQLFIPSELSAFTMGGGYDAYGNVRVLKVVWKSRRKIGKLTYFDEYGNEQSELVPEDYNPVKELGENVEWMWINEWWEGHKIGNDIYCKIRPIPYQGRSMFNASICKPPYVGSYANTDLSKAMSLMDIMKPLDYLYDIYSYRRELAVAKYLGPMLAFNMSLIPSGMDMKNWLHYVTTTGLMPLDPTNEILKGPSQGKNAGAFNTLTATTVNSDLGNFIQQHTILMEQLKQDLDEVSGVSRQRLGEISSNETVGGVERAVNQSSHITEKWFAVHDRFKKRVLERILETAKYVWKNNPKKCQFVLDDMQTIIVENYDEFFESEYDVMISDSSTDQELFQALKQLSQAALQNQQATFADVISIYKSESIQAVARKLEESSRAIMEQQSAMEQQKMQAQQQMAAEANQVQMAKMELDKYKIDQDNLTKIQVATIGAMKGVEGPVDMDGNGIADPLEVQKLALDQQDLQSRQFNEQLKLQLEERKHSKDTEIKERELANKKDIEDKKIKAIEVQNKNQEKMQAAQIKAQEKELQMKERIERIKLAAARAKARQAKKSSK